MKNQPDVRETSTFQQVSDNEAHQGDDRQPVGIEQLVQQLKETRSEEHTSELQSQSNLVCRLLLEKKNNRRDTTANARISMFVMVTFSAPGTDSLSCLHNVTPSSTPT